jgi:hypothetical protein
MVKSNLIGMGIVMMNIIAPSLLVKIGKLKTEEWLSGQVYKVIEMLDK